MTKDFKKSLFKDIRREIRYTIKNNRYDCTIYESHINGNEFTLLRSCEGEPAKFVVYWTREILYSKKNECLSIMKKIIDILSEETGKKLYSDINDGYQFNIFELGNVLYSNAYTVSSKDGICRFRKNLFKCTLYINLDSIREIKLESYGFRICGETGLWPEKFKDWLKLKKYLSRKSLIYICDCVRNMELKAPDSFYNFLLKDGLILKRVVDMNILHNHITEEV